MSNLKVLKNRNYALLVIANGINRLGDAVDAVALTWLVYDVSNSASLSAINFAINYLPTVCLQPLIGAFVTNQSKQKMMVLSDLARGIVVGMLAGLTMMQMVQPWMIIISTFLLSLFETFRLPSANAMIPLLIKKEQYHTGISVSSSVSKMFELIGSGIAGAIIALCGTGSAVLIDCFSFFASAFLLSLIRVSEDLGPTTANVVSQIKLNLIDGFHYVTTSKVLMILCALTMIANMMLVPFNALQSAFIDQCFHGNAIYLSVISTCLSIGSLIGAALYAKASQILTSKTMILMLFPLCAFYYLAQLSVSMLSITGLVIILLGLINVVSGICVGIGNCELAVSAMNRCGQHYLSRVSAVLNAMGTAMIPLTSMIISVVSTSVRVSMIFLVSGILMIGIGIVAWKDERMDVLNG